ncbi:MAG: hypothetical protein KBF75_07760 [Saprospiraceae bacterium]|jgi:hypothetical protein|nr:hypothetical protein [Saprospiraceae bacterium]HQW94575.1 hypothetical protein [Saprospiraceae bacterium]
MELRIRRVYNSDKESIPEDPDYLHSYLQNKAPPNINTFIPEDAQTPPKILLPKIHLQAP